jgi:hypothetical protein
MMISAHYWKDREMWIHTDILPIHINYNANTYTVLSTIFLPAPLQMVYLLVFDQIFESQPREATLHLIPSSFTIETFACLVTSDDILTLKS